MIPRIKTLYMKEAVPALMEKFSYKKFHAGAEA